MQTFYFLHLNYVVDSGDTVNNKVWKPLFKESFSVLSGREEKGEEKEGEEEEKNAEGRRKSKTLRRKKRKRKWRESNRKRTDEVCLQLSMHVCMHACMHSCVRVCICVFLFAYLCVYAHMQEPTSGLDSALSLSLITKLTKFAEDLKKTIIMTIHQPSSRIFHQFGNVLLMTDGEVG